MAKIVEKRYVIGIDFGTDSARAVLMDVQHQRTVASKVAFFKRWATGLYCDPGLDQYRQHPLDYIEAIDELFLGILGHLNAEQRLCIAAIGTNTTASTPVAVDKDLVPLALKPDFEHHVNAMFILWKDHVAIREAKEITDLAKTWEVDYTKYVGGIYSSEWFWSKILHVGRTDKYVYEHAHTWIEQSDWIPSYLTGVSDPTLVKRNRGAAGHKAMWNEEFEDGLPSAEFLRSVDPLLERWGDKMFTDTYTSDEVFGFIDKDFALRYGLSVSTIVTVGGIDAHHGAVGSNIEPYHLVKVIGTSTCDMLTVPKKESIPLVKGICGQVDGSIVPDMIGFEAGQSAFGDIFNWLKRLIIEPYSELHVEVDQGQNNPVEIEDILLELLTKKAEKIPVTSEDLIFTDFFNGRRTPDADFNLKAAAYGFSLATTAVDIFKGLVEAAAFGSKSIINRFRECHVPIEAVIATGGIPTKFPYIVQVLADVLDCDIQVLDSEQTCALGSAIFASVASGMYPDVKTAQNYLGAKISRTFHPRKEVVEIYRARYQKYLSLTGKKV